MFSISNQQSAIKSHQTIPRRCQNNKTIKQLRKQPTDGGGGADVKEKLTRTRKQTAQELTISSVMSSSYCRFVTAH